MGMNQDKAQDAEAFQNLIDAGLIPDDDEMRALAKKQYEDEGSIEIDDNAVISRALPEDSTDGAQGAYVAAWVWVYYPEKEEEE